MTRACACCHDTDASEPTPLTVGRYLLALVGVPNCGKTALFNALTGSRQKVANYAGVTVERKEGSLTLSGGRRLRLLDLPGTMSLRARSPDEEVTRDIVLGRRPGEGRPDAIVCVGDATNLRPTLRLLLELRLTGLPVLLAVNMMDIARARGRSLDLAKLSERLGIPVVSSVAVRRGGTQELIAALERQVTEHGKPAKSAEAGIWHPPDAAQIRRWHAEAETLLRDVTLHAGRVDEVTRRLDRVALHPIGGIVLLLAVLFLIFQAVFSWAGPLQDGIDQGFTALATYVNATLPESLLRRLLTEGVLAGVGAVLVFLPQIVLLFLGIILLEDFGYMARAAFLMDRLMGAVGLHGRAFIPLLSSFACAIPGIMATRTIENPRARLTTIMIAPLMTCSARLPVYTLVISALIPNRKLLGVVSLQGLVMFGLYAVGIVGALLVATILKRSLFKSVSEPLMLSLPDYKLPSWRNVAYGVSQRAWMFVRRAGTTIFALSVLLWFLASFPAPPEDATLPPIDYSIAGMVGHALAPLLAPIGFSWQMTLALIPAMAAREVAVAALGTIYAVGGSGDAMTQSLAATLQQAWPLASALSFLIWFAFAPQCFSTLAVVRRETGAMKWPLFMFAYMIVAAYMASFITYRLALAFGL